MSGTFWSSNTCAPNRSTDSIHQKLEQACHPRADTVEETTVRLASLAPLVSVIVPVYNEETTVVALVEKVLQAEFKKEILIVDDGSTDGSWSQLQRFARLPWVRLLRHSMNCGKGASISTALAIAAGEYTVIQDADLEYDPNEYSRLIALLQSGAAKVVYGSRYSTRRVSVSEAVCTNRLGVMLLNFAARLIYGQILTDEATCFKAFPTSLLRSLDLKCRRFDFCPEVTAKVSRLGIQIVEVPITYAPRRLCEGKKIRLRDGISALSTLWRFRNWTSGDER